MGLFESIKCLLSAGCCMPLSGKVLEPGEQAEHAAAWRALNSQPGLWEKALSPTLSSWFLGFPPKLCCHNRLGETVQDLTVTPNKSAREGGWAGSRSSPRPTSSFLVWGAVLSQISLQISLQDGANYTQCNSTSHYLLPHLQCGAFFFNYNVINLRNIKWGLKARALWSEPELKLYPAGFSLGSWAPSLVWWRKE